MFKQDTSLASKLRNETNESFLTGEIVTEGGQKEFWPDFHLNILWGCSSITSAGFLLFQTPYPYIADTILETTAIQLS